MTLRSRWLPIAANSSSHRCPVSTEEHAAGTLRRNGAREDRGGLKRTSMLPTQAPQRADARNRVATSGTAPNSKRTHTTTESPRRSVGD